MSNTCCCDYVTTFGVLIFFISSCLSCWYLTGTCSTRSLTFAHMSRVSAPGVAVFFLSDSEIYVDAFDRHAIKSYFCQLCRASSAESPTLCMVLRCCNTRLSARFDYRSLIANRSVRDPSSRTDSDYPFVERRSPFRNRADFLFTRHHPVHHGTIEFYDQLVYLSTLLDHS